MITTLCGKNSFELLAAKKAAVSSFLDEHGGMALEKYDGETAEPGVIRDALTNLPFLAAKKLVVLDSPSKNKQLTEKLPDWLEASDAIDVLIVEPAPDKRTGFYKFLQKHTDLKEFPLVQPRDLATWIQRNAAGKGVRIAPDAVRLLIERVGAPREGVDPLQYAQELDKLALNTQDITKQDVAELVEELPQNTVFDMLDALVAGHASQAMQLYVKLIGQKIDPSEILAMIIWQVQTLMLIRTAGGSQADAAKATKLHPYVIQKNFLLASRLSLQDMKKMTGLLLEAELAIKRDGMNADGVVSTLLATLADDMKR